MKISIIDQAIIVFWIVSVGGMGAFFAKYSKSMENFFVAGRKMTYPLILASMLASWHGIAFYLWLPGTVFTHGWNGWLITCGAYVAMDLCMGYFFAFKARMIGGYTVPDLFGVAYGKKTQLVGGVAYFIFMCTLPAQEMLAIGLVLNFVFGISPFIAIVISAAFVTIYCFVAGQYAVFATDFVQYVVMAFGLAIIAFFSFNVANSGEGLSVALRTIWDDASKFRPTGSWDLTMIIGLAIPALTAIYSPLYWSRAYCAKDPKTARDGILSSLYDMVSHDWLLVVIGLSAVVILPQLPDNTDQTVLHLATQVLPTGLVGFVFAALIAAGLSTINSSFLGGAANFGRDLYQKFINPKATQKQVITVGRIGIIILALMTVIIGYFSDSLLGLVYYSGQITSPVFVVPIAAIFIHRKPKTTVAAIMAMVCGIISSIIWLIMGEPSLLGMPMPGGVFGIMISLIAYLIGNNFGHKYPDVWNDMQKESVNK